MSVKSLNDLFIDILKDTYDAEKRIVKALPKLKKAATSPDLKQAFESHLEETKGQVERLEQIFDILGKPKRGKTCPAMEGLIEEGAETIEEVKAGPVLDAALIACAQKVEHYEIAAYGTLATYAKMMKMDDCLKLLKETLSEEKDTDGKLTKLAESINFDAEVVASR